MVNCEIDTEEPARRNYFKADYDTVRCEIAAQEIARKIRGIGVDQSWCKFKECIEEVINKTIPLHKKINSKKPWVTRKVQKKDEPR